MAHAGPPELPKVVDEAGETPRWVPILGLCLLGAAGLWVAVMQATGSDEPADAAEVAAEGGEGEAEEGAAEAPALPAPAPADDHAGHDH